ncbi:MAG: hypothetical protein JJU29_08130 [Verrucomicrobia bacterium]|nr:hypothetical protein [Verrucomicrobiota bacterium]MCH8511867.1 hypothetical protein [Kiritimatiellia bacterium]
MNLDLQNPHNADSGSGNVETFLPGYEKPPEQITDTLNQLRNELKACLERRA